MTRVLLADDQAMVRVGLRKILEAGGLTVVDEAEDGLRAVQLTAALRPDVVLMDIRMPILDGIEATRRIVAETPDSRVLVLTTFGLEEVVFGALRAGASGFVLKEARPEELLEAIAVVARGEALLSPAITATVIREFARRPDRPSLASRLDELTPREQDVLRLLARGLSNAEIAAELVVGEGTVKTHVAHVLAKLGVRDRVQAVVFAYEAGVA
jgi:DNA-binding NarL/FixJ family response regulator